MCDQAHTYPLIGGRFCGRLRPMATWLWVIAIIFFLVIALGSLTLGRYLIRKGTDIERHHDDGAR
jgi:hypothetical protein